MNTDESITCTERDGSYFIDFKDGNSVPCVIEHKHIDAEILGKLLEIARKTGRVQIITKRLAEIKGGA